MKDTDWQILYELYRTPNMTKVANRLYISQPALSKRIRMIESEFGVEIVERTPKALIFTKAGKILAQNAEEYMNLRSRTERQLQRLMEGDETVITLGIPYTYSKRVLSEVIFPYTQMGRNVRFEIRNDSSTRLFEKACDGDVDVAFVRGKYESDEVCQYIVEESRAYILSRDKIEIADLPDLPRLTYASNDRTKNLLRGWWAERYDVPMPAGFSAGAYMDVAIQLAAKGMGYVCCFLPDDYENPYDLVMTPMLHKDGTPVIRNSWFIHRAGDMSPELQQFVNYIKDVLVIQ